MINQNLREFCRIFASKPFTAYMTPYRVKFSFHSATSYSGLKVITSCSKPFPHFGQNLGVIASLAASSKVICFASVAYLQ
jgi:hypothetical protein